MRSPVYVPSRAMLGLDSRNARIASLEAELAAARAALATARKDALQEAAQIVETLDRDSGTWVGGTICNIRKRFAGAIRAATSGPDLARPDQENQGDIQARPSVSPEISSLALVSDQENQDGDAS